MNDGAVMSGSRTAEIADRPSRHLFSTFDSATGAAAREALFIQVQ
jgi:hypothetical protein